MRWGKGVGILEDCIAGGKVDLRARGGACEYPLIRHADILHGSPESIGVTCDTRCLLRGAAGADERSASVHDQDLVVYAYGAPPDEGAEVLPSAV